MRTLQNLINIANNNKLSEQVGMVYQIWDDGEITMQKSGNLLWDRNLHSMKPAIMKIDGTNWPHRQFKHGFAFVTKEDAEGIRAEIKKRAIEEIQMIP